MPDPLKPQWHEYSTPDAVAAGLAARISGALQDAVSERGTATLAVSGGRTPRSLFKVLSDTDIDWGKVVVTLVDERFVPPGDERSNERLVKTSLLQGKAASAQFIPFYRPAVSIDDAAAMTSADIAALPQPFDVVVLGMGPDGHTASFFPDAPNFEALIANNANLAVMPVFAPSAIEPRLTLSVQLLTSARLLVLHIESQDRRTIFEDALSGGSLPIARLFAKAKSSPQIYWAP